MRFSALVVLAVIASTVPSLAAPAPYSPRRGTSKRDTASTDDNTVVDTFVRNGVVPPRIGTVILPGANLSLTSKRDTTPDIIQAIEAAFNDLPPARKRDITADITAALQTFLQETVLSDVKRDSASSDVEDRSFELPELSSSVNATLQDAASLASIGGGLSKIFDSVDGSSNTSKREADSILPVEERSIKIPKIPASASSWLNNIGNVISVGVGASAIADAFGGSNSTRRDLDQTFGALDVAGAGLQFEDRSFKVPASAASILGKVAGVVNVGSAVASVLSAFDGSGNSTKRDLGMDSEYIDDQKRAVSSDIESILQQIMASFEDAADASGSTSTPTTTKRYAVTDFFLGLTDSITPEQLDELS